MMLDRQRLARLYVPDDLVDLGAVQRALDAQHGGQREHDIAVREQQIVCLLLAERQKPLNRLRRPAAHRSKPDRLLNITQGRRGLAR